MRRLISGLFLLAACGPKPPVLTALRGDLPALKRDIDRAARAHELSHDAVIRLARAVAEREVMSAVGSDGARRVRSFRTCANPLRRTMLRRAEATDDVAAELTAILIELYAVDRVRALDRYADAESGAWRSVAAEAALGGAGAALRARFFADPDERVRRAAFRAAYAARDESELMALLDAARLDPDPDSRSLAARAVGAIGGEVAVLALKDLWAQAEEALRISIVDAWAEPASFASGGQRELSIAVEAHAGLASVSAGYALSRSGGSEAAAGNAWLRRYIADGTEDEKRLASTVVPLDAENSAALAEAAKSGGPPELRVIALSRLAHVPEMRARARLSLREIVSDKPGSATALRAHDAALSALADVGDQSVHAKLVADLSAKDRATRFRAARGLISLGDYTSVAPALADDDLDLRSDLACTILTRADRDP